MPAKDKRHLGKLPPMYTFVLNPHVETRVSTCPACDQRMHQRKVPLFIHVDPKIPVILGYTCRYCPDCDLLVAHQDQIEDLLARMFAERDPSVIGNDYLVVGTVERAFWREGMKTEQGIGEMLEHLHDFKEVRKLEYRPAGWYPDEGTADGQDAVRKEPAQEQRRGNEHVLQATDQSPPTRRGRGNDADHPDALHLLAIQPLAAILLRHMLNNIAGKPGDHCHLVSVTDQAGAQLKGEVR